MNSGKQTALPSVGCVFQSVEGLNRIHRQRKKEFARLLLELDICLCTGIQTIAFPSSQASELELNYSISFPGSPTFRPQIVGLLSLHNCVSQVLIIILFISTYMEKALATHSGTLAWRISWTEEPGRLQSIYMYI